MDIKQIIVEYAPLAANIAMTIVIPFIIKNFSLKRLQKRIDEVNNDKEFGIVNKKLDRIENEILEMRGKRKWKGNIYG